MTIEERWYVIKMRCYEYSSNWYYHHRQLSKAVKEWRTKNTLTLAK